MTSRSSLLARGYGRHAHAAWLVAALAFAAAVSLWQGKDVNWDLENYHFYNPYALLGGRIGWDIAPAQVQTYYNALLDLPFYAMVRANFPGWIIAVVLAVPAGLAMYLLARILPDLLPGTTPRPRIARGVALAIGCTGSMGIALMGSTMNEWPGAMLVMAALGLLLRNSGTGASRRAGAVLGAGMLAGMASGLKLTAAPYAVGLCVALLAQALPVRIAARQAFVFAAGTGIGFLATGGYWMATLWRLFQSPVFPYFNAVIRSPWWEPINVPYRVWGPHKLREWLTFPLDLFTTGTRYTELGLRDWRLPVVYVLGMVVIACACQAWIVRRLARDRPPVEAPELRLESAHAWRLVWVFWIVSLLIWAVQHSYYRYVIPLELLSGALVVRLLARVVRRELFAPVAVLFGLAIVFTARVPDWGRRHFDPRYFAISAPELPEKALVIVVGGDPLAYVIPYMRPDARFVGYSNSVIHVDHDHKLAQLAREVIDRFDGPMFSLAFPQDDARIALARRNLVQDRARCALVTTNMPASPIELCRLERR